MFNAIIVWSICLSLSGIALSTLLRMRAKYLHSLVDVEFSKPILEYDKEKVDKLLEKSGNITRLMKIAIVLPTIGFLLAIYDIITSWTTWFT